MTDYSREDLIKLCEDSIRPESAWDNRDSEMAHRQVGEAWALLKARCEFRVLREDGGRTGSLHTDDDTVWIEIDSKGFQWFELGDEHARTDHFYIPTRKRLEAHGERDWY